MLQKIARILTLNFDAKELRLNSGLEQEPEVLFDDNAAKDEADRFQSDTSPKLAIKYPRTFVLPKPVVDEPLVITPSADADSPQVTPPAENSATEVPATPQETKSEVSPTIADVADNVKDAVDEVLDDIDKIIKKAGSNKLHTEFGMDKDGNIVFQEANTKAVYDEIFSRVKKEIQKLEKYGNMNLLNALGGDDVLEKLVQSAWMTTYNSYNSSQSNNTEDFVKSVLNNLNSMLTMLEKSPEMLEIFTQRGSYADSSLTNGLKHYNTNTTYGGDEKINYSGTIAQYADGTVHIDNTIDDNDYQQTMEPLLERIIAKYPDLDPEYLTEIFRTAQKDAIEAFQKNEADCPYGTGNNSGRVEDYSKNWGGKDNRKKDGSVAHMDQIVQMTLYSFDKLLYQGIIKDGSAALKKVENAPETPPASDVVAESGEKEVNQELIDAADYASDALDEVIDDIDKIVDKAGSSKIHTEFGMDKNGNIVFQESSTKAVYDEILNRFTKEIGKLEKYGGKNILSALGGEAALNKLVQAAWIEAYGAFNSSQSNNTEAFVTKVLDNLESILKNLQSNPDLMETYSQHTSYADTALTDELPYSSTKKVNYGGKVVQYSDGTVHIDNTAGDVAYQGAMEPLLQRLIEKYPNIDKSQLTSLFRAAQKAALAAMQGNTNDCPYGTANNNGRVEDNTKDWSGKDNRKKDGSVADMSQILQMTLYNFDKLFYAYLNT